MSEGEKKVQTNESQIKYSPQTSVSVLKGVGETRMKALCGMGINTLEDLVRCYPRAYQNRGEISTTAEIKKKLMGGESDVFSVVLTVSSEPTTRLIRRGMSVTKLRAFDEYGTIQITYFNQQYLKSTMHTGGVFRFFGRVSVDGRSLVMANPITEPYTETEPLRGIVPVYPLRAGLKQKFMSGIATEALRLLSGSFTEFLPSDILAELSLPTYSYAMNAVHNPMRTEDIVNARRRLTFNELFLMMLALKVRGNEAKQNNSVPIKDCGIDKFTKSLTYELTNAQKRCISEIIGDMSGDSLMNRILTGDVGSGKTIVAASACYAAVKNGYRAALMVPTEILAEQHAEDFCKLFSGFGIKCVLLTGSTKKKEREMILAGLRDGGDRIDIVIGTQALISEDVVIDNLGLAVIDEQHRFGVTQRAALFEKAESVHCLVMSATPIPRTMTLAAYGSIAVSRIDELPSGRQKTDTFIVNESYRSRLIAFIKKQADEGHQTYVVCPAVEEKTDSETDSENMGNISFDEILYNEKLPMKAAETTAEELSEALPELKVGLIHGKMKNTDRERVMREFERGEIDVLVSTTVIEVGVNVPNASLMIVENAERFGLSQLHQLRGRVGRGKIKSYFILVSDSTDSTSRERLRAIKSTTDGFEIAEYDLKQRGPGDFFSDNGIIRQSGEIDLALASACTDTSMIEKASYYAEKTAAEDPTLSLEKNKLLRRQLARFIKNTSKTQN